MRRPIIAAAMLAALSAAPAHAVGFTLDFTGSGIIPNNFGDNGWADLSYRAITQAGYGDVGSNGTLQFWTTGYADLDGAAWSTIDGSHGEIRIEARNPGETVTIDSFDMGGWSADEAAEWFIFDLAWNQIGSGTGIALNTGPALNVAPGISAVGGLIFQWGADSWDVGVENFAYSVTGDAVSDVPVPAAAPLLLGALGLLALRRRA
ncbi:hypothetical protein ACQ5SO_09275 [Rhodovulum sp. DZ06]|uniref:hypothetical protein n=1 Tax=Rhodovulum sp. DZ06 TaxID=3425126 RepID=UPI003D358CAA